MTSTAEAGETEWIEHPLLSPEVEEIWDAHPELSAAELYSHLIVMDSDWVDEEGVEHFESHVEWAETEPTPDWEGGEPQVRRTPVLNARLRKELERNPEGPHSVILTFDRTRWDELGTVAYQRAIALIEGRILTRDDVRAERLSVMAQKMESGARWLEEEVPTLEAHGATVEEVYPLEGQILATVEGSALSRLAELPEVTGIDLSRYDQEEDAGHSMSVKGWGVDGIELEDLLQTTLFYADGYYGADDEFIGHLEAGSSEIMRHHRSFYTPGHVNRVRMCKRVPTVPYQCQPITPTGPGWWDGTSVQPWESHETMGLSVAISDITGDQDADWDEVNDDWGQIRISDLSDQQARSGVARKSLAMTAGDFYNDYAEMTLALEPNLHIVTHSASEGLEATEDGDCEGDGSWADQYNLMFESDIAIFNSTGNHGHDDEDGFTAADCRVGEPANAIGVMAVNQYYVKSASPWKESLSGGTSRGGTPSEGDGRTVISLAGPSYLDFQAGPGNDGHYNESCATQICSFSGSSAAAPAIAGAAAVFREWYLAEKSSLIEDPGHLYNYMLLSGDRAASPSPEDDDDPVYATSGFDNLWGAGRVRLKQHDGDGLDSPYSTSRGSACIRHGQHTYIPINGDNPVNSAADYMKVTGWWYDPDHDDGYPHDKVDFSLEAELSPGLWISTFHYDGSDDNKKMIFVPDADWFDPAYRLRLKISGRSVASAAAHSGCAYDDQVRVYWAYLIEDNARNDSTDENTYIRPEFGL